MTLCLIDPKYTYLLDEPGWYIKEGYVARNPKLPTGKRTTQRLHVLIYELESGVKLQKGFVIHHRNENTLDNRMENLQLMPASEHISHHSTKRPKPYVAERNRSEWMRSILRGNKFGGKLAGDANGRSKITDAEWLDALARLFCGEFKSNAELARYLGIERTQVGYVIKGISRRHLQPQILELKQLYGRK